MPYPAEKVNIKISYTHSSDTPRGDRGSQNWGSVSYCTCSAAWVWCSQKSLSNAPWRNCPSFLIYLICSQTGPYKKPKQTLHFPTVRIIIISSGTQSLTSPQPPETAIREKGRKTHPLPVTLPVHYIPCCPNLVKEWDPLKSVFPGFCLKHLECLLSPQKESNSP